MPGEHDQTRDRSPSRTPSRTRRIFLSYRRDDTAGFAGRLHDELSEYFGPKYIFRDIETIEPGADFVQVIEEAVRSCEALVVVIGREWLDCTDAHGRRRLDDPHDFVRLEIATALDEGIVVIPVLVEGAGMPATGRLPAPLTGLARRNALQLSDDRWDHDVARLIARLEATVGPPVTKEPAALTRLYRRVRRSRPLTALVSLATVTATALGLYWGIVPFFEREPGLPPMAGDFNVAVAPFSAVDPTGRAVDSPQAAALARSVFDQLDADLKGLEEQTGFDLEWRGPDQLDALKGSNPGERALAAAATARATGADLVLYGVLRVPGEFTPELFVSELGFETPAEEFFGQHQLGSGIPLAGELDNPVARSQLREALLGRTQALAQFVLGLSYAAHQQWQPAYAHFQNAERTARWPDRDGKELLYLFLGNGALKLGNLDAAQGFYEHALSLNPEYARAYIGAAEVQFHRAKGSCEAGDVDAEGLRKALDGFARAATARVQPALADIPAKFAYGQGRVHLCLSQALVADHWSDAERKFREVIQAFDAGNPRLRIMAAESHADLGFLHLPAAGDADAETRLRRAAGEYQKALELFPETDPDHRRAFFWSMIGFIHGRLGDIANAERAYDQAIGLASDDPVLRARYEADRRQLR